MPVTQSSSRRRLLLGAGIVLLVVLIALWALYYVTVGQFLVSTDDAYLAADSSLVAPKISGYVTQVAVRDDEPVRQGQLLVRIDPRDYQNALNVANAALASAQAQTQNDQAMLDLQQAKIAAAAAALQGDEAHLAFATQDQRRYARLTASGASPVQTADEADTSVATARAQVAADQANLQAAQRQVAVLQSDLTGANAAVTQARAQADQAALNLAHTEIRAPFDGVVGNKSVTEGDYLQPGTQIMAIVPLSRVYVIANYKETQITRVQPGQLVRVHVDGFPGLKLRGHVDSLYPASGQEFSLLPPDNATGNFTKIVQRVPVKIVLDLTPDEIGKLRPGMSVEPEIDTRGTH